MSKGADVECKDEVRSIIFFARICVDVFETVRFHHQFACRWCCVCAGEYNAQYGWTALINAAAYGRAECVRLLIDAGADKEAKTNVRRWSLLF